MEPIRLSLDSKKRITISKVLRFPETSSVLAWLEGNKIILEPLAEIPAGEAWLFRNKKTFNRVKRGLAQTGTIDRGSFAKYAKKDRDLN